MNEVFYIYNGTIKKASEPIEIQNNRAMAYGDGCFETILAFNSQIPLLLKHIQRLIKTAEVLSLELPNEIKDYNTLTNFILYLAHKNKLYKTFRAKLTVYRNSQGLYRPNSNSVSYLIETFAVEQNKFQLNLNGLKIDIYSDITKNFSAISSFKTLNALANVLGQIYAKNNGLDDVLFLNLENNIVEATSSNVFIVNEDNSVQTPPLSSGCIDGVMRGYLIENILPFLNLKFIEKNFSVIDLTNAKEVFLSNAIWGVRYVLSFKNKRYFNSISQLIINALNNKLFE